MGVGGRDEGVGGEERMMTAMTIMTTTVDLRWSLQNQGRLTVRDLSQEAVLCPLV